MNISKSLYSITPNSSNVLKVEYFENNRVLQVTFVKNGQTSLYNYYGVPKELALQLKAAASVGSFIHKYIRGKYQDEMLLNRGE
jgi:hypothetical protein